MAKQNLFDKRRILSVAQMKWLFNNHPIIEGHFDVSFMTNLPFKDITEWDIENRKSHNDYYLETKVYNSLPREFKRLADDYKEGFLENFNWIFRITTNTNIKLCIT
ncbi:MAG: hypothetical protein EBU90_01800 [Proteobacteria bacterium]|nr:hypothetical protein [Pseudomonadota bacterium]